MLKVLVHFLKHYLEIKTFVILQGVKSMSLLDSQSKAFLVESMRNGLIEATKSAVLEESAQAENISFIKESATYEQLLNATMNPLRESKYLPAHTLEGAVAILSEAMLTGREVIGLNAVTEGALNLIKKTECVVTESMLDAALEAATSGGLSIVAEAIVLAEAYKKSELFKKGKEAFEKNYGKGSYDKYRRNQESKNIGIAKKKAEEIRNAAAKETAKKREEIEKILEPNKKLMSPKQFRKMVNDYVAGPSKETSKKLSKADKHVNFVNKTISAGKKAAEPLKKKMSTGKKAAIGAIAATGLAAGAYGVKKWYDKKKGEKKVAKAASEAK